MNDQDKIKDEFFDGFQKIYPLEKEFLDALILGNYAQCSSLAHSYLANQNSIKELYEYIIKKSLYNVGELWEYNKISVSTEHLASSVVEAIMNQLYLEIISTERNGKTVVAACVENELHQIGIKMISDVFEMNSWNALFLGSNTPTADLLSFIKLRKPDLLAISLSLYFNLPSLEKMIQKVQKEFPNLPILVGGQAFLHGGEDVLLKYDNVVYKSDLSSTEVFIKNFKCNG